MGRNGKPRKPYKAREVSLTGWQKPMLSSHQRVMNDQPIPAESQVNVAIAYHISVDAMLEGWAVPYHFDTLIYALNIGVILAERGLGLEYIELIRPALATLAKLKAKITYGNPICLDEAGASSILMVADLHELQVSVATKGQLASAMKEMHRLVDAGETQDATKRKLKWK